MADLGQIARPAHLDQDDTYSVRVMPFPMYFTGQISAAVAQNGELAGVVTEAGTPLAGVRVWVYYRPTMRAVAKVTTDENGQWSVEGVSPALVNDYLVIVQDKPGGTVYNDGIYAQLTAV